MIGVTNPFFAKVLKHWPHILRIGDASSTGESSSKAEKSLKYVPSLLDKYVWKNSFLERYRAPVNGLSQNRVFTRDTSRIYIRTSHC